MFCNKFCPSEIEDNENYEQNNEDKNIKNDINKEKNKNEDNKLKKE